MTEAVEFDIEKEKERFDLNEVIYSLSMEDVFHVIENEFEVEDQKKILKLLNADTVSHKLEIDWCAEIQGFLSARYLNDYIVNG